MASTFVQCIAEPEDVSGEEDPLVARRKNKDESTKPEITFMSSANEVIRGGPISILLIFVPCALVSNAINMPEGLTFTLSLLGLAPMAERLGFVTEQLALHTNESVGGLLNATFGNATELIVAATALFKGLYRLVQLSMLGSILSNMLLVLGSAFFLGGNRHKAQTFSKISSQMNATLLILSCLAILGPTILTMSGEESRLGELGFSRITSIMLIIMYFAFLYFQLFSHKELYESGAQSVYSPSKPKIPQASAQKRLHPHSSSVYEYLPTSGLDLDSGPGPGFEEVKVEVKMDVEVMSPNGLHKRENSASAAHSTSGGLVPMQPDMKENESKNSRNIHDPNSAIHYKIFRRCFACTCMCNGCCNIAADSGITKPKDSSSVDLHHLQQQGSSTINCDGDFTTDDSSRDSDSFPTSTVNVRTAPLGNEGRIRSASVREEEEEDLLGFNNALFWLGLLTVLISILSDAISSSIEEAAEDTNMSGIFLAAIVLPIVGNAAEHASAISFAMRNKMDIALAVAVGSSTQIALCVLPLLVIIGWGAGLDMSLNFGAYESSMLLLCVIAVTFAIKDGTSNWLLGLSMIVAYCIIAIGFYAHRNDTLK